MTRLARAAITAGVAALSCGGSSDKVGGDCITFSQWGRDASHSGAVCVAGQKTSRTIATVFYDPFVEQEVADAGGDILIHYQAPLIAGDDVYMMSKGGTYTPCNPDKMDCSPYVKSSQRWLEKGYRWEGEHLVEKWSFESDWVPEPGLGFEPMFQPAMSGDFLYIPGLGGSLRKVDRATGREVKRITPFGATQDIDLYVAGGVTADADGNVYYTAMKLDHDKPYSTDATGWLVKVADDDSFVTKTFQEIVAGAPAPTDKCRVGFNTRDFPLPWPPADVDGQPVLGPEVNCLSQRPGINASPAIGADGTIFVVSRAHGAERASFVTALRPDLTTRWSRSLAKVLNDGCGVLIPIDNTRNNCRTGARMGVDPAVNELPSGRVTDGSSASPVALPDGGVLYGSYTGYNGARGHLLKLDKDGNVVASHDFGWDTTPAIYRHDGTYSVIIKDNTYGVGQDNFDHGPFYIKQLKADLSDEWKYLNTNTKSCHRLEDGTVMCPDVADHPHGFEWCINAPVVDSAGVVYANSEDGNLYAIGQGGTEKGRVFLEMAIGAAYTPLAIDASGRIYTMNDGKLSVIGK